ncbi:MAG: ubiquinol-cytochrome c reductase iron-sulfur subunit [Gemmatimonadales bacterium]|jgi:Rieske Fe-S protein
MNVQGQRPSESGERGEEVMFRRRFLNWMLGTGAGALCVAVLYPIVRFLVPPEVEESTASKVTLPLAPREIPPNSGQIFRFGSRPGIILRTPQGELRAFDGQCTHLDCIVQYREDLRHIWCACHNGHYDLNGTNIEGPPPRPLPQFNVVEQGDKIIVSKEA